MPESTRETHPSYGVIRIGRSSGGNEVLFGSSVRHQYKVRITISTAELIRDELHYDRHLPKDGLIEIEMSQSQFSEFITSMNLGAGVPCTIGRIRKDGKYQGVEDCPTTPKREQFEGEFRKKLHGITKDMSQLMAETNEILDKKSILKSDRVKLQNLIASLERTIKDHIPFMSGMWNEQMDKTVTEAKGEVEAFTESVLTQAGLGAVHEKLKAMGHNFVEVEALPSPKEG